eukprot:TRINITY_DN5007_c0_g1_i2.p1 TRINITY_DN5007_c0_g1~~TRINITY_DN5007_c0_g1_i2.p1  ORF type:complete len:205 (-),score=35.86 TRINITY_DN5007_c0_g1_i2:266-880(-)
MSTNPTLPIVPKQESVASVAAAASPAPSAGTPSATTATTTKKSSARPRRPRRKPKVVKLDPPVSAAAAKKEHHDSDESSEPITQDNIDAEVAVPMRKQMFNRELRMMMYGFGDVRQPLSSTVDLVEEIVGDYITNITQLANQRATKRGKLLPEDIIYVVRNEPKKLARAKELLQLDNIIKKAKRVFDEDDAAGDDGKGAKKKRR